MMRRLLLTMWVLLMGVCGGVYALKPAQVYCYEQRDTGWLHLAVYKPDTVRRGAPTIVYFHGGGFSSGAYNLPYTVDYCKSMQARGYTIVSVDYRLALRHLEGTTMKSMINGIEMAVDDGVSALCFLLRHAKALEIDSSQIYLLGNSAGAIISLQLNYYMCNADTAVSALPSNFSLAGVIAYSGAVLSHRGVPKYRFAAPPPTLFFHGTDDKLVPYKKIQIFCLGFFGSSDLVKRYAKERYPYYIRRYEGYGHAAEAFYANTQDLVDFFVDNYCVRKEPMRIDERFWDPQLKGDPALDVSLWQMILKYK